jgi:hypothetical protein
LNTDWSIKPALGCLMALTWFSAGLMAQDTMRVTHVLGLESLPNNTSGNLSIQGDALRFQKVQGPSAQLSIASIQDIFIGEQDKQVGGTPMALGRAGAPFGGGRAIALFSHKKYDTLTMEYRDPNGGLHGAILQLSKGQAQGLKDKLAAGGAHVTPVSPAAAHDSSAAQWSVQVDKVDPGDVDLDPAFRVAIYENLLVELAKEKQFKQVFRSGDNNATGTPGLLILKITVQNFAPGSETKRAVTTVAGATKLKVQSQLCTPDGKVVVEKVVDGNVRFFGGNLRATHNLAHHVAARIKQSALPEPTAAGRTPGGP